MKVTLDGVFFAEISSPDDLAGLIELGDAPAQSYAIDADDLAAWQADQLRAGLRKKIGEAVGDVSTLLGITSDAASMGILFLAADTVALAGASNFAAYKTAKLGLLKQLAGEADPVELAGGFLEDIRERRTVLPVQVKGGLAMVLDDVRKSGTAVSAVLASAYPGESNG